MLREFYAKPAASILIILLVTVAGIYEFIHLPIALYPQTSKPEVRVWINTEGTNADEFFARFGEDIESAIGGISGVENVVGRYRNGNARYEVQFGWGVDSDTAEAEVRNSLGRFTGQFPDHWREPWIRFAGEHSSMIYASLRNNSEDALDIYGVAEKILIPRLRGIPGVESAWVRRPTSDRVIVELLPDQLLQHRLTSMDVRRRLKEHEYDQTLGTIRIPGTDSVQVAAVRQPKDLETISALVVGEHLGRPIRLREVAEVRIDQSLEDQVYTSDSQRLTMIAGTALPDANIQQVSKAFVETLRQEAKAVHPGLEAEVLLNPAEFIDEAVSNVVWAVIAGMLIATVVVLLFLRSLSSTLVVCISIPLSLIGGFILMDAMGIEVNLISLGAMALAVGMVVDGAVVVLENIVRFIEARSPQTAHERLTCVWDAVAEVRRPIFASLLTTIIVFAPLPFTSPLAAAILGDLAIVMVCVLVVSIAVTIVFIPPLVLAFSAKKNGAHRSNPRWFEQLQKLYLGILEYFLQGRRRSLGFFVGVAVLMVAAAVILTQYVPRSIIGEAQSSLVMWRIEIQDDQMSLDDRVKIVTKYEREARQRYGDKIVKTISETKLDQRSTIWLFIRNRQDYQQIREDLNTHFRDNALVHFRASNWAPTKLEIPSPPDIKLLINAPTMEERRRYLDEIQQIARDLDIFYRVSTTPNDRRDKFIRIELNNEKLSLLGKNKDQNLPTYDNVYDAVASALRDETLYTIQIGNVDYPVIMSFPAAFTRSLRNLGNLLLNYGERVVPLRALAEVEQTSDWAEFYTEDARPLAYVEAWIDAAYGGSRQDAEALLKTALLHEPSLRSENMIWENTMREVNENIYSLGFALVLALMLISVVITIQFGLLRQTALIMLAIPLGFVGVSFSLFAFQSQLSVNSMLGLILLCGTAVNNSILFVDFFNHQRRETTDLKQALLATAQLRFRPIMLTTLTTILGMLPIALGFGSGGEILQPLGIAVCGGLWVSTLLTVIAVPLGIWSFASE